MARSRIKNSKIRKYLAIGGLDVPFLMFVLILLTIGLIMLFSSSYITAYYEEGDSSYFFKRQLFFAIIGVIAMFIISSIKYEYFKYLAIPALGVSILLLLIVLVVPEVVPGFKRWIPVNLGPLSFTFQPSEIAKFALILFLAWNMDKEYSKIVGKFPVKREWNKKLSYLTGGKVEIQKSATLTMAYFILIGILCVLVALENHLSGTILIFALGIIMMYLGGVKMRYFLFVLLGVVLVAILAIVVVKVAKPALFDSYKIKIGDRFKAWLDKDYDPRGVRWQVNQSLYAIGSGGFFGTGLGNSKQKHQYVSEPQNDFIFAIVCEELGFVGAAIILILFALLVWRGFVIGMRAKNRFGSLLAMGLVFQVGLQAALNVAVVTDTIPNTGISLPFFSYGGTSLGMLLIEMGMVLAVSRYSNVKKVAPKIQEETTD